MKKYENERHLSGTTVYIILGTFADKITEKYSKYVLCVYFDKASDNGAFQSNILNPNDKPVIIIGTKSLQKNTDTANMTRDCDFIQVMYLFAHEAYHMEQYVRQKCGKYVETYQLDVAKDKIISRFYKHYYEKNYWNLPAEIEADLYALQDTRNIIKIVAPDIICTEEFLIDLLNIRYNYYINRPIKDYADATDRLYNKLYNSVIKNRDKYFNKILLQNPQPLRHLPPVALTP